MYRELVNRIRGGKIIDISRSCDLVCIKIETIDNPVYLHIQSFFRVLQNGKIVISVDDIYKSRNLETEEFEWDVPGNSVFDESLNMHRKEIQNSKILKTRKKLNGDFAIFFEHGYVLEIFVDTVLQEEKYRFFDDCFEYIKKA